MEYLHLLEYKGIVLFQYSEYEDNTYWYEENTCVSNFLGDKTEEVFCLETGDTDRHGIFKVVSIIPCDEEKRDRIEKWMTCGSVYGKKDVEWLIEILTSI